MNELKLVDKNKMREKAYEWLEFLNTDERMINAIKASKESAVLFRDINFENVRDIFLQSLGTKGSYETKHIVADERIEDIIPNYKDEELAVINYADFKKPGGLFLKGEFAQEEALCHCTGLYPVLEEEFNVRFYLYNYAEINKGKYNHSMIAASVPYFIKGKFGLCYILTCAAPNFRYIKRYESNNTYAIEDMRKAMRERQELIYLMAAVLGAKYFVAGPWGCGVFKNDPYDVATGWKELSEKYPGMFKEIIHTCPNKNSNNYRVFKEILG